MKCSKCVLQWKYVAGNNWGMCDSEHGKVGCGPQEEFRACSDIQIGEGGYIKPPLRPNAPSSKPKLDVQTSTQNTTAESGDISAETTDGSIFITFVIIFLSFVLVLCILAAIYLYYYHGQKIKDLLRWKNNKDSSTDNEIQEKKVSTFQIERPPVPPPRTKRLSLVREMTPDYPSVA